MDDSTTIETQLDKYKMWKSLSLALATAALVAFHTPMAALAFFGVIVAVFIANVFASTSNSGQREV